MRVWLGFDGEGMMRRLGVLAAALALVFAAGACSGDDGSDTTTPAPATASSTSTVPDSTVADDAPVTTTSTVPPSTVIPLAPVGLAWGPGDPLTDPEGAPVTISAVAAAGPGFVAVGWEFESDLSRVDAVVLTSADGVQWSRVPADEEVLGGPTHEMISGVVAGGPGVVAVGVDYGGGGSPVRSNAAVWTSVDGVTWSRVADDEVFLGGSMYAVTAGGPGLVAVGADPEGGAVWTSVDGLTWQKVSQATVFAGPILKAVTAWDSGLVAVGHDVLGEDFDAAVWVSRDGHEWSRVPHDADVFGGPNHQYMVAVVAAGPGLVAVGEECVDVIHHRCDAAVWTSRDGLDWNRVRDAEVLTGAPRREMTGITAAGPGLIAVGHENVGFDFAEVTAAVWVSADGIAWERVPVPPTPDDLGGESWMVAVAAREASVVAVGQYWQGGPMVWLSPPPG